MNDSMTDQFCSLPLTLELRLHEERKAFLRREVLSYCAPSTSQTAKPQVERKNEHGNFLSVSTSLSQTPTVCFYRSIINLIDSRLTDLSFRFFLFVGDLLLVIRQTLPPLLTHSQFDFFSFCRLDHEEVSQTLEGDPAGFQTLL